MTELGLWQKTVIAIAEALSGLDLVPGIKLSEVSDMESDPEYLENQGWRRHVRDVKSPYFEVLRKTESLVDGWFSSESVTGAEANEEVFYRVLCPTFLEEPITIECLDDDDEGY